MEICGLGAQEKSEESGEVDLRMQSRQKVIEVVGGSGGARREVKREGPRQPPGNTNIKDTNKEKASRRKSRCRRDRRKPQELQCHSPGEKVFPRRSGQQGQICGG